MIKFVPYEENNMFGIKALDNDKEAGYCNFVLNGYEMEFISVDCTDEIITEGLARAAMNFGANRFAYIARINKNIISAAFIRLGFSGDDVLSVEIPVALTSGCNCGH